MVVFGIIVVVAFAVIIVLGIRAIQRKTEKSKKPDLMTSSLGLGVTRSSAIEADAESNPEFYSDLRSGPGPIVLGLASGAQPEASIPIAAPPPATMPAAPSNIPVQPAIPPAARPVLV